MSKALEHGRSKICPNHLPTFRIEQHCIFPTHSAMVLTISSLREQLLHFPTHNLLVGSPLPSAEAWHLGDYIPPRHLRNGISHPPHPLVIQQTNKILNTPAPGISPPIGKPSKPASGRSTHSTRAPTGLNTVISHLRSVGHVPWSVPHDAAQWHIIWLTATWRSTIPCGSVPHDLVGVCDVTQPEVARGSVPRRAAQCHTTWSACAMLLSLK